MKRRPIGFSLVVAMLVLAPYLGMPIPLAAQANVQPSAPPMAQVVQTTTNPVPAAPAALTLDPATGMPSKEFLEGTTTVTRDAVPARCQMLIDRGLLAPEDCADDTKVNNIIAQNMEKVGAIQTTSYDATGNQTGTAKSQLYHAPPAVAPQNPASAALATIAPKVIAGMEPRARLPIIFAPELQIPPAPSEAEIDNAELWDYIFAIRSHQGTDPDQWGYGTEYPGFPLWLYNWTRDDFKARMMGYYESDRNHPFGIISSSTVGTDFELQDVWLRSGDGNYDVRVWADRVYHDDTGATQYSISLREVHESDNVGLFMGATYIFDNLPAQSLPNTVNISTGSFYPAFRYTIRHVTSDDWKMNAWASGEFYSTLLGRNTIDHGFTQDLHDPAYGRHLELDPGFVYDLNTYHDCSYDVHNQMYHGYHNYNNVINYAVYGYESRIAFVGSVSCQAYIEITKLDLGRTYAAIAALSRSQNPDQPFTTGLLGFTTTPRQVARTLEGQWNGSGIPVPGKPAQFSSAIRTSVFGILETMLGYYHNDQLSKNYANLVARSLIQARCGKGTGSQYKCGTVDNGNIVRTPYANVPLLGWQVVASTSQATASISNPDVVAQGPIFDLPDQTIISNLVDIAAMPSEVSGIIPTNGETVDGDLQFWRLFRRAVYGTGMFGPNSELMPAVGIKTLDHGDQPITFRSIPSGWHAQDVIDSISKQSSGMSWISRITGDNTETRYPGSGSNFAIEVGRGYILWTEKPFIWHVVGGNPIAAGYTINIPGGTTTIGIPAVNSPRAGYWGNSLKTALQAAGCTAVSVFHNDQGWKETSEGNFPINEDEGYLVQVANGCNFTP